MIPQMIYGLYADAFSSKQDIADAEDKHRGAAHLYTVIYFSPARVRRRGRSLALQHTEHMSFVEPSVNDVHAAGDAGGEGWTYAKFPRAAWDRPRAGPPAPLSPPF